MKSRVIDCAMCQAFVALVLLAGLHMLLALFALVEPSDARQFMASLFAAFVSHRVACVVLEGRS